MGLCQYKTGLPQWHVQLPRWGIRLLVWDKTRAGLIRSQQAHLVRTECPHKIQGSSQEKSVSSTNRKNKAACTCTARLSFLHCLQEPAGEPKDIWEHAENPDVPSWARSHFPAGHRVWLGNHTGKFVLPKGNPLGAKYTAVCYGSQLPGKRTEETGESFKIRTRWCILVSKDKPSNVPFVDQLPCVLSRAVWTWPSTCFCCCIT